MVEGLPAGAHVSSDKREICLGIQAVQVEVLSFPMLDQLEFINLPMRSRNTICSQLSWVSTSCRIYHPPDEVT